MTKPGDPGREQVILQWSNVADAVVFAAREAAKVGAYEFEHGFAPPEGVEWPEDHTPSNDEAVLWYAQCKIRHKLAGQRPRVVVYRGEALVKPGASHGLGASYACVDMLEKMGINVVVFDNTHHADPERAALAEGSDT